MRAPRGPVIPFLTMIFVAISFQRYPGGPESQKLIELSAAASRRLARVIRLLISTSCAREPGGGGSRACDPELSGEGFHRPACGSILESGRGQKRQGKAGRGGINSCARTGVRLSEINRATTRTLGHRLR